MSSFVFDGRGVREGAVRVTDPEFRIVDKFKSDPDDPTASWEDYLARKQGPVGLAFPAGTFHSTAEAQTVGQLQTVRFTTGPLAYRRGEADIRRADGDNSYRILVPMEGTFGFEQREIRKTFKPGEIVLFHWDSPLRMTHEHPISAAILTVPASLIDLARAAKAPLALDGRRPLVRALRTQIELLATPDDWSTADFSVGYTSALHMLNGALNPYPDIKSSTRAAEVELARHLVEALAHDRSVTPAAIATMLGIGERTLYRALDRAGYPPVGVMIREVRLDRAHQRLLSTLPVDIESIALEVGFPSLRSLRDAYRNRHGRTPAEMREKVFSERTIS